MDEERRLASGIRCEFAMKLWEAIAAWADGDDFRRMDMVVKVENLIVEEIRLERSLGRRNDGTHHPVQPGL